MEVQYITAFFCCKYNLNYLLISAVLEFDNKPIVVALYLFFSA